MTLDYLDFELEIGQPTGQDYPITVLDSPAGNARATITWPFGELASGGVRRTVLTTEEQAILTFGVELFDWLFSSEVRNRYDVSQERAHHQGKGLRVKLRIQPPALAVLPWEFLYDPRRGEYICLSQQTPVVRYLELAQSIRPLQVTPPLHILAMIASPTDQTPLDVVVERQRMERALEPLQAQGLVKLVWLEGQSWRDLQRALRREQWHIFHFVGHGDFDPVRDEGLIILANALGKSERFSASDLGRLLADHRSLRLVVLNACLGAQGSRRDLFASTAARVVRSGLPAVVAMQYSITDAAAIEFTQTFYESLADGLPVDAAMSEARKAISFAVTNSLEWGTPVLYSRASDGRLFMVDQTVRPPSTPPPLATKPPAVETSTPVPTASAATFTRDPQSAIPTVILRPPLEIDWVTIPAGEFIMGSDKAQDKDAYDDELPQHRLHLPEYRIARLPVTVADFTQFIKAAKYKTTAEKEGSAWGWNGSKWEEIQGADWAHPRGPQSGVKQKADHPVTCVSWVDAMAFANGHKPVCPPKQSGRKPPVEWMVVSIRGAISHRTKRSVILI